MSSSQIYRYSRWGGGGSGAVVCCGLRRVGKGVRMEGVTQSPRGSASSCDSLLTFSCAPDAMTSGDATAREGAAFRAALAAASTAFVAFDIRRRVSVLTGFPLILGIAISNAFT